jgi:hypothetical protein
MYGSRAVFGWGGQRHKATNRQAEQASPPNPTMGGYRYFVFDLKKTPPLNLMCTITS